MKNSIRLFAGLFITMVCAAFIFAQTNRGGISGTVFDKTGAVIPGAQVTITNVGTNRSQKLTTSEEGAYTVARSRQFRRAAFAGSFGLALRHQTRLQRVVGLGFASRTWSQVAGASARLD
jgi:hypothetical protein